MAFIAGAAGGWRRHGEQPEQVRQAGLVHHEVVAAGGGQGGRRPRGVIVEQEQPQEHRGAAEAVLPRLAAHLPPRAAQNTAAHPPSLLNVQGYFLFSIYRFYTFFLKPMFSCLHFDQAQGSIFSEMYLVDLNIFNNIYFS